MGNSHSRKYKAKVLQYVSQEEIEEHKVAMQRVVDDEKRQRVAINDKKKRAIEAAQKTYNDAVKRAENDADEELKKTRDNREERLLVMQRDFERLPLLRQVYHEAPNDVFEVVISKCSDISSFLVGRGGLNTFRLANKRCKQVVESCTMSLETQEEEGPDSFSIPIIQRCRRVERMRCHYRNLRSLNGCPHGLKQLLIGVAPHLSDISAVASCSMMESFQIPSSSITDISVVASMPLLKVFCCEKDPDRPSIEDLSPLESCLELISLDVSGNRELQDLSPLSACKVLERIIISRCPLITSLAPLSKLKNLREIYCSGIGPQTSLLPLVLCTGLKYLNCSGDALDLDDLRRRRPDLTVDLLDEEEGDWEEDEEEGWDEGEEGQDIGDN